MITDLINSNNNFRPFFKDGQTNHLPMTLLAMYKLGASSKELNDFIQTYKQNHKMENLFIATSKINVNNWTQYLGQTDSFEEYQEFFESEIREMGFNEIVKKYFNCLISGIASEAFHCLIKLCYAVESNNTGEIANSLAYMCACYFEIPTIEKKQTIKSFDSIIKDIESSNWFQKNTYEGDTISKKIIEVFKDPGFSKYIEFPDFNNERVIGKLKNSVLRIHLRKWNFTSLHLVTSFHSLKIIEPFVWRREDLYKKYWTAIIGCFVTMNKTTNLSLTLNIDCEFNWDVIFKKALGTKNEHTIKLIYSCYREFNNNFDLLYEAIASRAILHNCV